MLLNQNTKKWTYIDTYGGKLTENVVQAIARDLLAYSIQLLNGKGYKVVMHVHDEVICEIPFQNSEENLTKICRIMSVTPPWASGLPLRADGYLSPFYKKD